MKKLVAGVFAGLVVLATVLGASAIANANGARPAFSATPDSGQSGTTVTVSGSSGPAYDASGTRISCSLSGQNTQIFPVTVTDTYAGTATIVALPAVGVWDCDVFAFYSEQLAGSFDFTYSGQVSVSSFPACPTISPTLAKTGVNNSPVFIIGIVSVGLLFFGVIALLLVRKAKSRVLMFAIPLLALGSMFAIEPRIASANVGAATVTQAPTILLEFPDRETTAVFEAPAYWINNAEGCGTLTYQWQVGTYDGVSALVWSNFGDPLTEPSQFAFPDGYSDVRLVVTLTNKAGSSSAISNEVGVKG